MEIADEVRERWAEGAILPAASAEASLYSGLIPCGLFGTWKAESR
jgi:hypothetical protein